jgi:hypothetical protein
MDTTMKYKIMKVNTSRKYYTDIIVYTQVGELFNSIDDAVCWLTENFYEPSSRNFIVIGEKTNETE